MNHRVKNNLYSIVSMLYKEKNKILNLKKDKNQTQFIDDIICRVENLSTIHTLLSAVKWKPLYLSDLLQNLTNHFFDSTESKKIEKQIEIKSYEKVNSSQAQHIAMVHNEILTNIVKHSTKEIDDISIGIYIDSDDNNIFIKIRDNGVGFPKEIIDGSVKSSGIGFDLIYGIVEQSLGGSVKLSNDNGAVYTITIKI